jgi:hypothetical protein
MPCWRTFASQPQGIACRGPRRSHSCRMRCPGPAFRLCTSTIRVAAASPSCALLSSRRAASPTIMRSRERAAAAVKTWLLAQIDKKRPAPAADIGQTVPHEPISRGTGSSNPPPSSSESANLRSHARNRCGADRPVVSPAPSRFHAERVRDAVLCRSFLGEDAATNIVQPSDRVKLRGLPLPGASLVLPSPRTPIRGSATRQGGDQSL